MASTIHASINYTGAMSERPWFHANDQSLDRVALGAHVVPISDAAKIAAKHTQEIRRFIQELTGADAVAVTGPGVLRFGERSAEAGTRDSSRGCCGISPAHRWYFFSDMQRDEVIVFKRHDTDASEPHHVPHSAFTDPRVPAGTAPRASIEMRTIAYWFE